MWKHSTEKASETDFDKEMNDAFGDEEDYYHAKEVNKLVAEKQKIDEKLSEKVEEINHKEVIEQAKKVEEKEIEEVKELETKIEEVKELETKIEAKKESSEKSLRSKKPKTGKNIKSLKAKKDAHKEKLDGIKKKHTIKSIKAATQDILKPKEELLESPPPKILAEITTEKDIAPKIVDEPAYEIDNEDKDPSILEE